MADPSRWLTSLQAALRVGCPTKDAFYVWTKRRREVLQPMRYGRQNLWDAEALDEVLHREAKARGQAA